MCITVRMWTVHAQKSRLQQTYSEIKIHRLKNDSVWVNQKYWINSIKKVALCFSIFMQFLMSDLKRFIQTYNLGVRSAAGIYHGRGCVCFAHSSIISEENKIKMTHWSWCTYIYLFFFKIYSRQQIAARASESLWSGVGCTFPFPAFVWPLLPPLLSSLASPTCLTCI